MTPWNAALILEDGTFLKGKGFGAKRSVCSEAVFNTGLSGYQEIFTDPSYFQQMVVMTYPHIGNTGVNAEDWESKKLYLSAVLVREYCDTPSNFRSTESLSSLLEKNEVAGISGIDTRKLTQILRDGGAQKAFLCPSENFSENSLQEKAKETFAKTPSMEGLELVSKVSTSEAFYFFEQKGLPLCVVYDFGTKTNILRLIKERNFQVLVVPYHFPASEVFKLSPKFVMLSNGPGDPALVAKAPEEIKKMLGQVPIFAICMGHQLLARSLGCSTYKLKFGHHGINHPVLDKIQNKIFITSQNHGFAVSDSDLIRLGLEVSHVSLNDSTVEGYYSDKMKFLSLQFHPEVKPGPEEGTTLFDYFLKRFVQ